MATVQCRFSQKHCWMKMRNLLFSFKCASVHLSLSLSSGRKFWSRLEKCLDSLTRSLLVFSTKIKICLSCFLLAFCTVWMCKIKLVNSLYKSISPSSCPFSLSVTLSACASDPKAPQASSFLFSPSVLPLRLLFCPHRQTSSECLLPSSPQIIKRKKKKTHRGGGGGGGGGSGRKKKLRDTERG